MEDKFRKSLTVFLLLSLLVSSFTFISSIPSVEASPDSVTLNSPSDGNETKVDSFPVTVTFSYTPDFDEAYENATLKIYRYSTGDVIATETNSSTISDGVENTIDHSFAESGKFLWNVEVCDQSDCVSATSNYTLTLATPQNEYDPEQSISTEKQQNEQDELNEEQSTSVSKQQNEQDEVDEEQSLEVLKQQNEQDEANPQQSVSVVKYDGYIRFSGHTTNTTKDGAPCLISVTVKSGFNSLNRSVLSYKDTDGSWVNKSSVSIDGMSDTASDSVTLPEDASTFQYKWYAWTDDGNSSVSETQTLAMDETYYFYGPYWENNGTDAGSVQVTAHYDSQANEVFTLNGDYEYNPTVTPTHFSFPLNQGGHRIYYAFRGEDVYVFLIADEWAVYDFTFTINDQTGKLGQGDAHLEAVYTVNSTQHIVERDLIEGATPQATLHLANNTCYLIRIRWSDGTYYNYGTYCTGNSDAEEDITVTEEDWEDEPHTIKEYVDADAERVNTTHIQMTYDDTTPGYDTENVTWIIRYRNLTTGWTNTTLSSNSVTKNWYNANSTTDYVVDLEAEHEYWGTITERWILDAQRTFNNFPNLDTFGTWTIPTGNLLALLVAAVLTGTCTFISAPLAPFLGVTAIASITYLGGATYSTEVITLGYIVAIIMGLVLGRRR